MNPTEPRLKNLISFGKESLTNLRNSLRQELSVRNEDSFSFDFNREMNNLGVDVINVSERELAQSIDLAATRTISVQKVCHILMFVKESVLMLRSFVEDIRKEQAALGKIFQLQAGCKELRKEEQLFETTPSCSQSLLLSCETQKSKQKARNFTISSAFSLKLRRQIKFKRQTELKQQAENDLLKQIEKLQYQNDLHRKQIQILKRQISSTNALNQKRESLYNQKLKLKEIEWGNKINEIMHELNEKKAQGTQVKSWRIQGPTENRSEVSEYRIRTNRCHTEFDEDENYHQGFFNLKESTRSKNTADLSKTVKNISPYKKELKELLGTNQLELRPQQKGKLFRSRQRKQSTDFSYERVKEKIKNFESSIKKEMNKIQQN